MIKPTSSILSRILLGSLLPLICIFVVIILFVRQLVFTDSAAAAKSRATTAEAAVIGQIEATIAGVGSSLEVASESFAMLAADSPLARANADRLLRYLIDNNSLILSAWFVFEPGTFQKDARFELSLLRLNQVVSTVNDQTNAILDDPEQSPWYNQPLTTGKPLFLPSDQYDYGDGSGDHFICTLAYPVKQDGRTVGVVGMDILYSELYSRFWQKHNQPYDGDNYLKSVGYRAILVDSLGKILYSMTPSEIGRIVPDAGYPQEVSEKIRNTLRHNGSLSVETPSPFLKQRSSVYISPVRVFDSPTGLFLIGGIPTSRLYSKAEASQRTIFLTCLGGLALIAASLYLAARAIIRPIENITHKADRIAGGDLGITFDHDPNRRPRHEVDVLEDSLRQMLMQLNQNHHLKLSAISSDFERRRIAEAAESKARFFAGIAHEIRTPMNAIIGMSEALSQEKLADKATEYVKTIRTSSQSLLTIVNDILDFSKLESGKLGLMETDYLLRPLLDNLASIARFLAKAKNLEFTYTLKGDPPECLYGDEVRLRQILMNLLSNAIKFTRKGKVGLTVTARDDSLIFQVSDSGIGIKKEDLPHLFQPYSQVDPEKNRHLVGTGLGLSICKNLAELMRGDIHVASEYGKGSVFTVRIPKVQGEVSRMEGLLGEEKIRYNSDARVLAVDDSEVNLSVASSLLALSGVRCDTVTSGREALQCIFETDYDLVFLDHQMPDMDGLETAAAVRSLGGKYADLTLVALTANAGDGQKEMFLEAGMNDYLSKPIEKRKLAAVLARWIPAEKRLAENG